MTISFSTKKVVALAMGLALAFSAVFVSSASADTAEDLQAQIASLLAMIAGLQAQLGGDTGTTPTTGGSCTAAQFTLTHTVGDRGGEVMNIQKFLNANGFTVATAGAGSAGQETSFFGPATKAAAAAFQNAYASEILAPVGLSTGTGYWGSSSRAKANALEMARCTGSSDDDDDNTPTGDNDLTVSAAAQPGNSLAPENAQAVAFTRFTLTAGDDDVTVENITVELTGLAKRASFDKVVLLDEDGLLIGNEENIDSDDQAEVGDDFVVKAGKSKTFTVAANMDSTLTNQAGEVAAFSIIAINTDATVEGSLPITGAQHTINATLTIGTVDLVGQGTDEDVEIGDTDIEIGVIQIEADGGEDVRIFSVRLEQVGDADLDEAIDNLVAELDGEEYDVDIDGDFVTVDFGSGVVIEEGDREDLTLTADIVAGPNDTIEFSIDEKTDFVGVGEDYGYGLQGEEVNNSPLSNGFAVITIGAGDVVLNEDTDFDDEDVAAGTTEVVLGAFEAEVTGEDATGDIAMLITVGGSGTLADLDLDNVAIYNADGDRISDREDFVFTSTTGTTTVDFDDVTLEADEDELKYEIRGDINVDAPDGTTYTVVSIEMTSIESESGDDVSAPGVETLGQKVTVEGAIVTFELSSPSPAEINADTDDQIVAEIEIEADDSGDDIDVSEITVSFDDPNSDIAVGEVTRCELFDGSDSVSSREDAGAGMDFSVDLTVEKGETVTLVMKCDIDTAANADDLVFFALNWEADGVVTDTDLDETGNTGTEDGSSLVTVKEGVLTAVVTSDDENDDKVVIEGSNSVVLGIIEVEADQADVTIDDITGTLDHGVAAGGLVEPLDGNKIEVYVDGNKIDDEDYVVVVTPADATITITNLAIAVDNGEKVEIEFRADVNNAAPAAAEASTTLTITDITLEEAGATDVSGATLALAEVTVVDAVPVIAQIDVDTDNLQTGNDTVLFAYSVTADGEDVVLATTRLKATLNNADLTNIEIKVYDNADMEGTAEVETAISSANLVTGTTDSAIVATVSEGDTYYVFLVADVDATDDARSVRVQMDDSATGVVFSSPSITGDLVMLDDMKSLLKKD